MNIRASIGHRGCRLRHASFKEVERCEYDGRIRGACLAMSRFLTFVWMEAEAQSWKVPDLHRDEACLRAIESGLLKVSFP